MFASMLPDVLKTNDVILDCHSRLQTLFETSFGIRCYGTREQQEVPWTVNHKIDASASIGSLGKFYRRSKEAFPGTPYLVAPAAEKGNKFRVGISWTGGMKAGRVVKRTVPLSWWKTILTMTANSSACNTRTALMKSKWSTRMGTTSSSSMPSRRTTIWKRQSW